LMRPLRSVSALVRSANFAPRGVEATPPAQSNSFRGEVFGLFCVRISDAVRIDACHHHIFRDFDAKARD